MHGKSLTPAGTAALLTAVTAFLITGTAAGVAQAAPAPSASVKVEDRYTIDLHSNVRAAPKLKSRVYGTAGRGAYIDIDCWKRGQDVSSGGQHTNVWYQGGVWMGKPMNRYMDPGVWVWGGNVDTKGDPQKGIPHC
ncbi:hypothetical protein [Streptomyces sp. URMC 124]|uniref:hypothetical protein n=1 Tax=Streptomyces sp. URMC 124 TaxID=3423405 RepID=UPI003F19EE93